ncbi:site-2 protease family protein [Mycobacterium intracellulare]|uniref:Zinc metalloprotease n=1 Tax=Mycobacterium intracellulare subsp. chimaera TaxID=222805 RepID=A0A7U5MKB3_MYCIT|nr:site-2 protease family protein [Mycobacterium intracellulare]ASL15150.1 putative transmembrane alanine and leucine rich protein [Mycobacterium intracellulare subsp. chimaera]ASQ86335.1 site-2 protease family protein [Mycobacterium intracellulare subsp. chimaera]MCF1811676.1 site-2 protease family protein [Mycobacterium intracellulare subsp. intracellulare]MDM3926268.1 site-2 protease family protein [Mycobacterium intracellulare subsp. chimaera]MDS0333213.1 site-2 protease family protein [My
MRDAIPLGRFAGFEVKVHWSVIVILWLFTWSLASALPGAIKGYGRPTYWLAGACGAMVLLASLLAHELAHAVVARRMGVRVGDVTLWLFGGVTTLQGEAKTPKAAFWIAAAGPATSLGLSALFATLAAVLPTLGAGTIAVSVAWWLAVINLTLGLFNLLPGAPLDGGRLVRAYLWRRHGDSVRAAVGAAHAGRLVAIILIVLGLAEFLVGGLVGGVWLAFIGWFLFAAAREEELQVTTRQALAGVRVVDAMTANPRSAPGWLTVDAFIERYLLGAPHSAYPVADQNGSIVGLVTLRQLRDVAPGRRATTIVREIALPLDRVPTATPLESLSALIERLAMAGHCSRALVIEGGKVVGIITPSDLARLIDVYRLAHPGPGHDTHPQDTEKYSNAG